MGKGRLEAFSDGVIAILITIMILELKVPTGHELADLRPLLAPLVAYLLSFIYLGIYWNNHHHLMQAVKQVNGKILWANAHLLFWLSIVLYLAGIGLAFVNPYVSVAIYALVAVMWLVPDPRIEKILVRD